MDKKSANKIVERPPVIVVLGHIDHGKSTLLDYIRKTNVVAGEVGGITQRLSAYEVVHKNTGGEAKKITFLDTPGHEAFSGMRGRGVYAADIAILVVSAEDSVKPQTIEALKDIRAGKIPFIVAINKIDKPSANPDKVKMDLAEAEVYVEGFGGSIPCVQISAKTGVGVPELLDMILLVAEMGEFKADPGKEAEGLIIESHLDPKRGVSATVLIKNGTLKKGEFVVSGEAVAPVRLIEDSSGKGVAEATFSSPVSVTGWSKLPSVGSAFSAYETKKEAEEKVVSFKAGAGAASGREEAVPPEGVVVFPLIIKADTAGSLEAIEKEVAKIKEDGVLIKIVQKGVGGISETDIKLSSGIAGSVIVGFGIKVDRGAVELADRLSVSLNLFDIIYKLTEWLKEEAEKRRPKVTVEETTGSAKILKAFNRTKDRQVVGGRVLSGKITLGAIVKIMRRESEIGRGKVLELQQQKNKVKEVAEGFEFGLSVESKTEIAPGDILDAFILVTK